MDPSVPARPPQHGRLSQTSELIGDTAPTPDVHRRSELEMLKTSQLRARAAAAGVGADALADADDSEVPRESFIELVLAAEGAGTQAKARDEAADIAVEKQTPSGTPAGGGGGGRSIMRTLSARSQIYYLPQPKGLDTKQLAELSVRQDIPEEARALAKSLAVVKQSNATIAAAIAELVRAQPLSSLQYRLTSCVFPRSGISRRSGASTPSRSRACATATPAPAQAPAPAPCSRHRQRLSKMTRSSFGPRGWRSSPGPRGKRPSRRGSK